MKKNEKKQILKKAGGGIVFQRKKDSSPKYIGYRDYDFFKKDGKVRKCYVDTILAMEKGKIYPGRVIEKDGMLIASKNLHKLLYIFDRLKTIQELINNKYLVLELNSDEENRLEELKKKCSEEIYKGEKNV